MRRPDDFVPPEASDYTRFLAHWRRFPSHDYLDRAAAFLSRLSVGPDDPRLCAGTPRGASWLMPITLNNRYVFAGGSSRNGGFGLILRRFDPRATYAPLLSESFSFKPFRDEIEPPDWRRFRELSQLDDPELAQSWIDGAAYELSRRASSTFRKHHNGFLGALLTDAEARKAWRNEEGR